MALDNLSAVLHKTGDLRLENRLIWEPKKDDVQIRMSAIGISESDVNYWMQGYNGNSKLTTPLVLGHEAAGVVSKLGKNVTCLQVGDRVGIEPGIPCRCCNSCNNGNYSFCDKIQFNGSSPRNGYLCRYRNHAAHACYKLPENVSLEEGALLQPISVGVHACHRAGVTLRSTVLVCGAGPIGLVCLLVAKAVGASKVVVTDLVERRLAVAKSLGADAVVKIGADEDLEAIAKKVEDVLGEMPRSTIECIGTESSMKLAILGTKSGGCVVLVGLGPANVKIPVVNAAVREVDIRGVLRYSNYYQNALDMIASGEVNVKSLITHYFTLEESIEAFETSRDGTGGAIKVIIHP